ncbi:GDP-mannose 4,6-dehydratase [Sporolituus thermophilus]|uniref:UDP-glucuronate 4-epimerase n=1 Tax=Sporolituus thermophilus DSM 23256 TaxID=1123285 RepID=A0A1G7NFQ3_9FIRM|nr:GDP-mannose 4,6-dehydratase [Sporolituus thermophilus]SDF72884.1 UDP-glucuronate 4-epimerase [Sporolituus thermophilus DSM 23256]
MQQILVTGGAGFIGSHLVDRLLAAGYWVAVIDDFNDFYEPAVKRQNVAEHITHPNYRLYEGDIRDRAFLDEVFAANSFTAVVHLAARAGVRPSLVEPVLYQEVNVGGTQNIFECCRKFEVKKCIFGSSSSVYGINSKVPFAEDDPIFQPISPYAATKAAGELLAHVYSHLYGIQILCLRFFTVYGPRQRPDLAIHKFTKLIDQGLPIPVYGDGSTCRDYTYVDDIVNGIIGALHYSASLYEIINLGNSDTVYLKDLIRVIEECLGKKAVIKWLPPQPGDVPLTFADIGKARRLLDFEPATAIEEGIANFVAWYRQSRRD